MRLEAHSTMLKYALIFLVISLIAGAIGLTGVSAVARRISFVLFGIFLVIAIVVGAFVLFLADVAT
ncbi:uncharacterized membrane protein YtjA (UPF0391 family) [Prosthecomicrobium pneumaticum]|uniref:UPF0391 membrane protein GGQ63_001894 n=2 Tax=Prosthecomicrobium pneumaticum TaxID=81895 RepID=A0A7W9L1J3_9HYPH|nr:uncharacterized membrane protein YtjA (UPF0391 family) [Prosthecomicrobium pneumaticum]